MNEFVQLQDEDLKKYEQFLKKLKNDELNCIKKLQSFQQKKDDFLQVIEYMNNQQQITKMNIGSNTFLDIQIINPKLLTLNIGLNVCIEVNFDEASQIIQQQLIYIENKIIESKKSLESVQQYISQVQDALTQI